MLYDYKCAACGKKDAYYSEKATLMRDADKVQCECGGQMERQFSKAHINMRGTKGITSRSDVEIETISQQESIRRMASE